MSVCSNCKAKLSCGCQRKTASDKTPVCSNCIGQYETKLKAQRGKEDLKKFIK
jgi:hypothetical protein